MGSIRHRGVRLQIYPDDHLPMHAHCFLGDAEIIVDFDDPNGIKLADRPDAERSPKRPDSRRALEAVKERYDELVELWKEMHA